MLCRGEFSPREILDLQVNIEILLKKLMNLRYMGENQKYLLFSFFVEFLLECKGGYFFQEHSLWYRVRTTLPSRLLKKRGFLSLLMKTANTTCALMLISHNYPGSQAYLQMYLR